MCILFFTISISHFLDHSVDNGGKIDPVKFNVPVHIVLPFPPGFFDVLSAQEGMLRARVAPQPAAAVGQKLITNVSASLSGMVGDILSRLILRKHRFVPYANIAAGDVVWVMML